jgi:hypothetical protein
MVWGTTHGPLIVNNLIHLFMVHCIKANFSQDSGISHEQGGRARTDFSLAWLEAA